MTASSRTEAQRRAGEMRVFQQELDRLEREGILKLGEEQRRPAADHQLGLLAG